MRLSTVSVLAVLLVSSVAFAQHHETASAPSAPAASPAPTPAPSFSLPSSSTMTMSHSAPSAPAPSSAPLIHSAPTPSATPSPTHSSMPASSPTTNSIRSATEPKPQSDSAGNASAKSPAANKLASDDRAAEAPATKRPAESNIRHPVCVGGKCPQGLQPPQDDLRRCILCKCPQGQSPGKGECVANPTNPPVAKREACSGGTAWNGSSCVPTNEICPAGQSWDGARCTIASCPAGKILFGGACMEDCTMTNARAYPMIPDVQSARRERDDACRQGPATTQCQQAEGHYQNALAEYRMLWAAAPTECRAPLPFPDTL